MGELRFAFPLAEGLHARPAAALRERALAVGAEATWTNLRNGRSAPLRSVLGLLATETAAGDPCLLSADGPRAATALASLDGYLRGPFLALDAAPEPAAVPPSAVPGFLHHPDAVWRAGVGLAPGLGQGPARFLRAVCAAGDAEAGAVDPVRDRAALVTALEGLKRSLRAESRRAGHPAERGILAAHAALLEDEGWTGAMLRGVEQEGLAAVAALRQATTAAVRSLQGSASARVVERAQDLRGLAERLAARLPGGPGQDMAGSGVLVAEQLPPSRLLALDRQGLAGLVLGEGGAGSHTAILARALGIPCIGGLPGLHGILREGQDILVDGHRGLLLIDPPVDLARRFEVEARRRQARDARLAARAAGPATTAGGHPLAVLANVSGPEETAFAIARGADGIGILRTELLFLDREESPSEDEQAALYAQVLRAAAGRPVVLRLLDAGGDKPMPFLRLPAEANPFLGLRGVRWYPDQPEVLRTQLRAALRAAAAGDLRLLVPMVSRPAEMAWVRGQLEEVAAGLRAEGAFTGPPPPLGMMVEVPAAALDLAAFGAVADFFSVGTNDLVQYLFAADRDDPERCPASLGWHPATLRLLQAAAQAARSVGRELSLCGALASDARLLPLLLGLGLDRLSVVPAAAPELKAAAAALDLASCERLAHTALAAAGEAEVMDLLGAFAAARPAPPLVDPDLVLLDADCDSKAEAIQALVEQLVLAGRAGDADRLEAAVLAREDTYSTGIGQGFAVPHAKLEGLGTGGLALLRLRRPLDWGAADGLPVHTVLLLATDGGRDTHLRAFARLARRLMDARFRAALAAVATPAEAASLLRTELEGNPAPEPP